MQSKVSVININEIRRKVEGKRKEVERNLKYNSFHNFKILVLVQSDIQPISCMDKLETSSSGNLRAKSL